MAIAQYYRFTPCCEGEHPVFFLVPTIELDTVPGVYNYTGPIITDFFGESLETGKCYLVEQFTSGAVPPALPFSVVVQFPDLVDYNDFDYVSRNCPDPPTTECPCVILPNPTYSVYSLQPCCGGEPTTVYLIEDSLVSNTTYIYTSAIPDGNLISSTCYTTREINYTGVGVPPFTQVVISEFLEVVEGCGDGDVPYSSVCELFCLPCICTRFLWTGAVGPGTYPISYIDCDNENQILNIPTDGVTWTDKICLKYVINVCPSPTFCWTTETFGNCNIVNGVYECDNCYELRDCTGIKDSVYTFNQQVGQYVSTQQIIQIVGDETCWRVFDTDDACECAVAVTVQNVFSNCQSCLTPKGFKLTECTTGEIQYTTTDLSDYTTAILQTDCPGCWTVEPIDIIPPSSQPVTVVASFEDCEICNSVFYELVDCNEILDSIITITDLSQYVGQFIILEYCPNTCWEVTITTPQEINGDVIVDQNFITCSDCTDTLTDCKCQSAVNTDLQTAKALTYVDCNSTEKSTAILLPGQRSEKVCALFWITGENIIDYGSCIGDVIAKQFTCPVPAQPKRKVTPGYNTAVCSTEYYERVVCNFADWMYKDVLERRYGISNCCPEELMKWEIRHEMLMLDVLVNPDYVCFTGSACNCPSSCDCGYISLTTKNGTCPS